MPELTIRAVRYWQKKTYKLKSFSFKIVNIYLFQNEVTLSKHDLLIPSTFIFLLHITLRILNNFKDGLSFL